MNDANKAEILKKQHDKIHETTVYKRLHGGEPSELAFLFDQDSYRSCWYGGIMEVLRDTNSNNKCSYTASNLYHLLSRVDLLYKIPAVVVPDKLEDKIEVAWVPNLPYVMIKSAVLRVDSYTLGHKDTMIELSNAQWFRNTTFDDEFHYNAGNDSLSSFKSELPARILNVKQAWFFSETEAQALRLLSAPNSPARVFFDYDFEFDFSRLLRIRVNGEQLPRDKIQNAIKNYGITFIDNDSPVTSFKTPQLLGKYYRISTSGIEKLRSYSIREPSTIWIRDYLHVASEGKKKSGDVITVDVSSLGCECLSIAWFLENKTASKYNNRGNFTTNPLDDAQGISPIDWSSLGDKASHIFKEYSSEYFISEVREHCTSPAYNKGHLIYSFTADPVHLHQSGILLDGVLTVKIRDSVNGIKHKYRLHAIMTVSREVEIGFHEENAYYRLIAT